VSDAKLRAAFHRNALQISPFSFLTVWVFPLEREITHHLRSGTGKSCEREMAAASLAPMICTMKTNILPRTPVEIRSYAELQQQIHDALRIEHPEWVESNGDCPTCDSYESRLAELLGVPSPIQYQAVV
jgi:hypothetical protein